MSRGRGRGGKTSYNREQLSAMGALPGDLPVPITEPSPLFPSLNRKPIPLEESIETDYLLILKQGLVDRINVSGVHLKQNVPQVKGGQKTIDKILAQIPNVKENFNWNFYPQELRPKIVAKRHTKVLGKNLDISSRLEQLEKLEENLDNTEETVKEINDENEDEDKEGLIEDEEDEEMDEGTDYANNYFDNGEGYEDDDELDEGPIY